MRQIFRWFMICVFVGLLALAFVPVPVAAMTGNGTAVGPYMIYDVNDLQAVANGTYEADAYYMLANDIDASATTTWNWDAGRGVYEGFAPLPIFSGNFSGNYYTISNLYMDWEDEYCCAGLFSGLGDNAVIENVRIIGADITNHFTHASSSGTAGVLVGIIYCKDDITIRGVMVEGNVHNYFTSSAVPNVRGCAGGMVGYIWHGSGLLIEECAAYVDVVQDCYINAYSFAGGFVGFYANGGAPDLWIRNCYARGDAFANGPNWRDAGGFCGWQDDTNNRIDDCYSTGVPIGWAGGFVGKGGECSVVTGCFWDTQSSGIGTSDCGTGKTTVEMQTESTFIDAGWDFDTVWATGGCVNDGYPYLLWWYDPPTVIDDIYQVVWFQPNAIIQGTTLPNRAEEEDGIITWGANPAGISISHSLLQPEEDYEFEPIIPETADIIRPEPGGMTGDVDLERLENNPFNPLVQAIVSVGGFTARLVWLGIAWFILIAVMIAIQLKTHHMMLTGIAGFGLASLFYVMGIFPLWVVIVFGMGMVASIIYERMTVL